MLGLIIILILLIVWYIIRRIVLSGPMIEYAKVSFDGKFGEIIEFDIQTGLPTYIKDSYGDEFWYSYDKTGKLIKYKNSKGEYQYYKYKNGIRKLDRKRMIKRD